MKESQKTKQNKTNQTSQHPHINTHLRNGARPTAIDREGRLIASFDCETSPAAGAQKQQQQKQQQQAMMTMTMTMTTMMSATGRIRRMPPRLSGSFARSLGTSSSSGTVSRARVRAAVSVPGGSGSGSGSGSHSVSTVASLAVAGAAAASVIATAKGSETTHPHLNPYPHLYLHPPLRYPSLPTFTPTTTFCEETDAAAAAADAASGNDDATNDQGPEIDPYDNLPEKDEPTHCSICLTYRQGPCRPYWRKVEACTKDHEKDNASKNKQKTKEGGDDDKTSDESNTKNGNDNGDESDDDDDGPGTRCFKYMMPWIDCASGFRNLYTIIEMDTNYTEGIADLEATSLHFCWMPGEEPEIDWTNWEQSGSDDRETETDHENDNEPREDIETAAGEAPVALWKTFDPEMGDPKLITIEARVPAVMASHDGSEAPGVLECAYATDQENRVIGFAYGTRPSDLLSAGGEGNSGGDGVDGSGTTAEGGAPKKNDDDDGGGDRAETIPLSIRLVASRTTGFVLAASYTHRRVAAGKNRSDGSGAAAETGKDNDPSSGALLESHLYKSKLFSLADVPRASSA